jgi:hypothetical protein
MNSQSKTQSIELGTYQKMGVLAQQEVVRTLHIRRVPKYVNMGLTLETYRLMGF